MSRPPSGVREYLSKIGAKGGKKGGKTTGQSKVRGDREYYQRIGQKAAAARKAKRLTDRNKVKP